VLTLPLSGHSEYRQLPSFEGISFGQGFVPVADFIYAYGGRQRGMASDLFVARFRRNRPEKGWAFWDGHNWNDKPGRATAIGRGSSTSMHVCKIKDRFLLTTSEFSMGCDQGKAILVATSDTVTGPFPAPKAIFTIDDTFQGHLPFFYFPVAHPEFLDERNELLITYSINGYAPCIDPCQANRAIPDHYRPKAIRVPLPLLDAKF
jgi:hypothetical protein